MKLRPKKRLRADGLPVHPGLGSSLGARRLFHGMYRGFLNGTSVRICGGFKAVDVGFRV